MSKPIFTKSAFIEFLETKNPDEHYPYNDWEQCACAQYAHSLGMQWWQAKEKSVEFAILDGYAADAYPRTFGNLLDDLKNANEERYQINLKNAKEYIETLQE